MPWLAPWGVPVLSLSNGFILILLIDYSPLPSFMPSPQASKAACAGALGAAAILNDLFLLLK